MLLFIFNMYETTFSFLGCILKFRFLNLYIIIIVTKIKGLLKEKRKGNGGVDKKICRANFQQRSFLATFAMDAFLIRCSLWDITFFQIIGGGDVIFMNNWWDFDVLGEIFISPKPFIVWSRATPLFNQKTTYVRLFYFSTSFREPEVA